MPAEQISYNEIEMREISGHGRFVLAHWNWEGRRGETVLAFEIAPIRLLHSIAPRRPRQRRAHWRDGAATDGSCLQRKLIEGIDKLAKNTTTTDVERGGEETGVEGGEDGSHRRQQQM